MHLRAHLAGRWPRRAEGSVAGVPEAPEFLVCAGSAVLWEVALDWVRAQEEQQQPSAPLDLPNGVCEVGQGTSWCQKLSPKVVESQDLVSCALPPPQGGSGTQRSGVGLAWGITVCISP